MSTKLNTMYLACPFIVVCLLYLYIHISNRLLKNYRSKITIVLEPLILKKPKGED